MQRPTVPTLENVVQAWPYGTKQTGGNLERGVEIKWALQLTLQMESQDTLAGPGLRVQGTWLPDHCSSVSTHLHAG